MSRATTRGSSGHPDSDFRRVFAQVREHRERSIAPEARARLGLPRQGRVHRRVRVHRPERRDGELAGEESGVLGPDRWAIPDPRPLGRSHGRDRSRGPQRRPRSRPGRVDRAEVVPARRGGSPGDGRRRRSGDARTAVRGRRGGGAYQGRLPGRRRQLADRMDLGGYLRPVNLLSLESGPLKPPPKEKPDSPENVKRSCSAISTGREIMCPQATRSTRWAKPSGLPGRGYVHLTAPKMMGKSVFVRGLNSIGKGSPTP